MGEFKMSNDLIAMDNSIVTSAYNLSVNEQRLIYCALKQMPKYDPKNPNRQPLDPKTPFYITSDDFIELGANPDNVAKEIRQATRELMKKSLFVQTTEGIREFHWLSEVLRYDRNAEQKLREKYPNPSDYKKYINALKMYNLIDALPTHKVDDNIIAKVVFHEKIIPLLSDLRASFTQFLLSDVAEFNSIYSYRIYQLFMQYLNKVTGKGWVQIDFYDLRFMLMLLDKYPLTADFKKRVIDPAIKEINEKSPLKAKYELLKKGRKYTAVKFTFEIKEKNKKQKDFKTDVFDDLTEQEQDIIAQKQEYARQKGITDPLHVQNLIKQALQQHQDAIQAEQEAKERKKAERQAQKEHEKQQLELARKQYEQILASDTLINAYIANNINPQKMRASLQKMRYEQGDFRGVFELEKHKFEKLSYLKSLNLKFLDKINS